MILVRVVFEEKWFVKLMGDKEMEIIKLNIFGWVGVNRN